MKVDKFLILGSSGLIGKYLKEYLEKRGKEVIEFDIKNHFSQDLRIASNYELEKHLLNSDFVFFLAFDVGGAKYLNNLDNNEKFLSNNTAILLNTFNALSKNRKPFIFASTYLVDNLENNYSLLKRLGESFTSSLSGINVRFWNIYGFETVSDRSHLIPDLIHQCVVNRNIKLLTDGNEKKQFLYVEDCCECLFEIALRFHRLNKLKYIDLSSFDWISVYDVGRIISELFNCPISHSKIQSNLAPIVEPLNTVLSFWEPKTSLLDGIIKIKRIYEESNYNRS